MRKTLPAISGLLFGLIFLLHLLRLLYDVEVQVGAWIVPHWVSYPAFVFFGILSFLNWRAALKG